MRKCKAIALVCDYVCSAKKENSSRLLNYSTLIFAI